MKILKYGSASVLTGIEKAIYSYNNVITTLNAKCASVVGNTNNDILDVRCVGSNPDSKNSENSTLYTSDLLSTLPSNDANYSVGDFSALLKSTDQNIITDYERMMLLGITESDNKNNGQGYEYYFASRLIFEARNSLAFTVRINKADLGTADPNIFDISEEATDWDPHFGVRPVITMSASALESYLDSE